MYRLGLRGRAVTAALAMVMSLLLSVTTANAATASAGCHYDLTLRQWVCQAAISGDQRQLPGPKPSTGSALCSWQGQVHQCHDAQLGWFDNRDGCYYLLM